MKNFRYYTPTQVIFGQDTESKVGNLVKQYGGKKVLVHYGSVSARKSGLLARVLRSLDEAGIAHVELGGVVPNPRLSKVREGIDLCRRENVDFLLAVGGGSVIDSSKAIAYGLVWEHNVWEGDVWELFEGGGKPTGCFPVGCVLTIAAAGSEMSDSCIITNDSNGKKRGVYSDASRPRFVIMNPALTVTLPAWQTAAGGVDIIFHTLERYFSGPETVEPTDSMAEGLMRSMQEMTLRAVQNPDDYEARASLMWAGSLSHNGLTGCGRGKGDGSRVGDWACHQLAHELGGMFDVTHGAALAAMWGAWARYVMHNAPARFARFARNVMSVSEMYDEDAALSGITAFEAFLHTVGMPLNLRELGIEVSEEQIHKLSWACSFEGRRTIGALKVLDTEDIAAIYRMAR